jgi:hypothetical protein
MVLQSNNGSKLIAKIVQKLMEIWPEAKIIHGRAHHPQSQGSVKRANQDIKMMLPSWLHDHNTNNWVLSLNFVQLARNTRHYSEIGNNPYSVMHRKQCRLGISSLHLSPGVIATIGCELDLDGVLNSLRLFDPNHGSQGTTPPCEKYRRVM